MKYQRHNHMSPALDILESSLQQERKKLLEGNPRDKHAIMGSLLLAAGTGIAIEGCANTYMRTGKLFPGPHLYAGEQENLIACPLTVIANY